MALLACPNCATAKLVTHAVWHDGFWLNLAYCLFPLLSLSLIALALYRVGRTSASAEEQEPWFNDHIAER